MRFKSAMILLTLCLPANARSATLVEDFSTTDYADFSASTGLWNSVSQVAQAAAVANADTARPISFGDGILGALSSSTGYTFDTDDYPDGFDFQSVDISGGTVTIQGSNALVIRSLTTVNIVPALSLVGASGNNGAATAVVPTTGLDGGICFGCVANGGKGGDATAGAAVTMDGGSGLNFDGTEDITTPGTGSDTVAVPAGVPNVSANRASADMDLLGFATGTGGGGGGAHSAAGDASRATGGGGGAAGGLIRISAVGDVTLTTINTSGGNGGASAVSTSSCSGAGGGGNGGAPWFQSLSTVIAPVAPTIAGGTGGNGGGCSNGPNGLAGRRRADTPVAGRPGWAGGAGNYDTTNAAASQTYVVQSKAYDLEVLNADFTATPDITSTLNGGTVSIAYSGSIDGSSYGAYVSDLTELTNSNVRYLKFKITITTGGVAAASPTVSRVEIYYTDLGLANVDLNLAVGCGSVKSTTSSLNARKNQFTAFLAQVAILFLFWGTLRLGHNALQAREKRISGLIRTRHAEEISGVWV